MLRSGARIPRHTLYYNLHSAAVLRGQARTEAQGACGALATWYNGAIFAPSCSCWAYFVLVVLMMHMMRYTSQIRPLAHAIEDPPRGQQLLAHGGCALRGWLVLVGTTALYGWLRHMFISYKLKLRRNVGKQTV